MFNQDRFVELSYDVVLPSHLLVSNEIEPSAKLLYGLIRNLTKRDGYCFADNKYLSELMDVSVRTVKRWLHSLESEGYVEVEFDTESSYNPERRIFIADNFKKCLRRDKNVPPPGQKCPTPRDKFGPPLYKDERRKKKEDMSKETSAEASSLSDFFLQKIKEKKEDFKGHGSAKWAQDFDLMMRLDNRTPERIKEVICWLVQDINNLVYVQSAKKLRQDFDRIEMKMVAGFKKSRVNENREYARKLKEKFPKEMKSMSFDDKYVKNIAIAKEVPFDLPHETFKEGLVSMFGGSYDRRN